MSEKPVRIESAGIAWSSRERARSRSLRWMGRLTAAAVSSLAALMVLLPVSAALGGVLAVLSGLSILGTAALGAGLVFGGRGAARALTGAVELSPGALVVRSGGVERRIAPGEVRQGWIEDLSPDAAEPEGAVSRPAGAACKVVLRLAGDTEVSVVAPDRASGEMLLRAAGVSTTERVLRAPLRSSAALVRGGEVAGAAGIAALLLVLAFSLTGGTISALTLLFAARAPGVARSVLLEWAAYAAMCAVVTPAAISGIGRLARRLRRREVKVGADGVAIEGPGKPVYVPYSMVQKVARDPLGVRLHLEDGTSLLLPTVTDALAPMPVVPGPPPPLDEAALPRLVTRRGRSRRDLHLGDITRRDALLHRIEQAMAPGEGARLPGIQLDLLDRGDLPLGAWRDRLRGLLAPGPAGTGYRRAAVEIEQLLELACDPAAPPERRIAATVAASGANDEPARARLRIAIDACAGEDLRAAMERAAEGEIEEEALTRATAPLRRRST